MTEYERGLEDGKKAVLDKLSSFFDEFRRNLDELKRKNDEMLEIVRGR